jgi:hypothetical protein
MHGLDAGLFGSAGLTAFDLSFCQCQDAHGAASGGVGYRRVADLLGFGARLAALARLLLENLLQGLNAFCVHGGFR